MDSSLAEVEVVSRPVSHPAGGRFEELAQVAGALNSLAAGVAETRRLVVDVRRGLSGWHTREASNA